MPLWDFYNTQNNKRIRLNDSCNNNLNHYNTNQSNNNNNFRFNYNTNINGNYNITNTPNNNNNTIMETTTTVSNTSQLLHRIRNLFQNPDLSDIKLIFTSSDGRLKSEFKLHKLILCSGSEVFRAMLSHDVWRESNTSEV